MKTVNIPDNYDLNNVTASHTNEEGHSNNDKIREILNSVRIDRSKLIEKPEVCLSVVHEEKEAIISTLGNFSLVIGKAKSRKTFSLILYLHALVTNSLTESKFKGNLPNGKRKIIYFDTEQGTYHVQRFDRRVCIKANQMDPDNFHSYALRKFTPKERLALIEQFLKDASEVGFVVIDGVRDLVNSINNEEEATKIASYLLRWTEEYNIHIVTVLHQNKGDNNARGHLGTELVNKAETVLSVTADEDTSFVEAEYCRDISPETFAFFVNDEGLPVRDFTWSPGATTTKLSEPEDWPEATHQANILRIFEKEPEQRGSDFLNRIMLEYKCGANKAAKFRTHFMDKGWVKRVGKSKNDPNGFWKAALNKSPGIQSSMNL